MSAIGVSISNASLALCSDIRPHLHSLCPETLHTLFVHAHILCMHTFFACKSYSEGALQMACVCWANSILTVSYVSVILCHVCCSTPCHTGPSTCCLQPRFPTTRLSNPYIPYVPHWLTQAVLSHYPMPCVKRLSVTLLGAPTTPA